MGSSSRRDSSPARRGSPRSHARWNAASLRSQAVLQLVAVTRKAPMGRKQRRPGSKRPGIPRGGWHARRSAHRWLRRWGRALDVGRRALRWPARPRRLAGRFEYHEAHRALRRLRPCRRERGREWRSLATSTAPPLSTPPPRTGPSSHARTLRHRLLAMMSWQKHCPLAMCRNEPGIPRGGWHARRSAHRWLRRWGRALDVGRRALRWPARPRRLAGRFEYHEAHRALRRLRPCARSSSSLAGRSPKKAVTAAQCGNHASKRSL
mmetsp:Transcript_74152/g.206116  ORF Transcript_74152/g.206116 Transcript_74152/m.206116 type:complete len:264 (-) Transcript_74152:2261-3052(-)